jgi:hypothetical protein
MAEQNPQASWVQVVQALGTLLVAVVAIWGEKIRAAVAGPDMRLTLKDPAGDLTVRGNGKRTIYYHLQVSNRRTWSPARNTRVVVVDIAKKRPDGSFIAETPIAPLQLTWAFQEFHELLPTIATQDVCDLGFIDEDSQQFELSPYVRPNNFSGFVEGGQSMRVSVIVSAHNYESTRPLVLEVSWDGKWDSHQDHMAKHLVVKEVVDRRIRFSLR